MAAATPLPAPPKRSQTLGELVSCSNARVYVVLTAMAGLAATVLLIDSISWEQQHDTPLLNYAGFLMAEHHWVPYRDFFETSMPGPFLFHYVVRKLGLAGDPAFILLGDFLLLAVAAVGSWTLSSVGRTAALLFPAVYILNSLVLGPENVLQRDWLAVVPISLAVLLVVQPWPKNTSTRLVLIGFLFGSASLVKPQLGLGAPVVVLSDVLLNTTEARWRILWSRDALIRIVTSLMGFLVPLIGCIAAMKILGSLDAFVFLLRDYLPLHVQQTGSHAFLSTPEKLIYSLIRAARFRNFELLVPAAVVAPLIGLFHLRRLDWRTTVTLTLLSGLTAIYGLVPVLSGQFWPYHFLPFLYFATLLICFIPALLAKLDPPRSRTTLAGAIAVLSCLGFTLKHGAELFGDDERYRAKAGLIEELEQSLERWVPAGGRVQPIDWSDGAIHAMLRREIVLATPFLYDYHFYHHVDTHVNSVLRGTFIEALGDAPPDVFVDVKTRPRVTGYRVDYSFDELSSFVEDNYMLVEDGPSYSIYRLARLSESGQPQTQLPQSSTTALPAGPRSIFGPTVPRTHRQPTTIDHRACAVRRCGLSGQASLDDERDSASFLACSHCLE